MILKLSTIVLAGLILSACKSELKKQTHLTTKEIPFTQEGKLYVTNETNDSIAYFNIEIAEDSYERQTGLMHRKTMKDNQGMFFVFKAEEERFFYMKNTYIPLDIIYINNQQKIVSIQKNAIPLTTKSLPSEKKAQYVLEIKAGLCDSFGLTPGQTVLFNKL